MLMLPKSWCAQFLNVLCSCAIYLNPKELQKKEKQFKGLEKKVYI